MNLPFRIVFFTTAAVALSLTHSFAAEAKKPRTQAECEPATRLQVFLDRAQFCPGKIDGHYGGFTDKALALYRESKGQPASSPSVDSSPTPKAPKKEKTNGHPPEVAPNVSGLDLNSVNPVFISYTVTDDDLKNVGDLPAAIPAQSKLKFLAYKTAAEAIAEKFHTDLDFLNELNPGKTAKIHSGDTLTVPNVEPFLLTDIQREVAEKKADAQAANDQEEKGDTKKDQPTDSKDPEPTPAPITTSVEVNIKTNMLTVHDNGQLVAAYPVTVGSERTVSPVGDWKVRGITKLPTFRFDESMLNHGKRSNNFHMLPPGPNNPVGVIWIQLSKKGIGLHGTGEPDSIGRSASHGCIRLANWDIVRLAPRLKYNVPVAIH